MRFRLFNNQMVFWKADITITALQLKSLSLLDTLSLKTFSKSVLLEALDSVFIFFSSHKEWFFLETIFLLNFKTDNIQT